MKCFKIKDLNLTISDGNYSSKYPKSSDFLKQGVPFIRANNLHCNSITSTDMYYISKEQHENLKKGQLKSGDVLITTRGNIGQVAIVPGDYENSNINAQLVLLRSNQKKILNKYLMWCFHAPLLKKQIVQFQTGTALKQLPVKRLNELRIPLPPLPVQEKIVQVLDNARELIDLREKQIKMLDELVQSVFYDMFGDPVTNPKGWEKDSFKNISKSRLGKMRDKQFITGKHLRKYIGNSNVKWFDLNVKNLLEMDFNEKERVVFELKYGDLLICEGGDIGRCAIWQNNVEDCYFQKALHRVRFNLERAIPEYIQYVLFFYSKRDGFKNVMSKATIAHLTGEKLKITEVPLPPISLQNEFASKVQAIEAQKNQMQASLDEMKNNYNSLMQRAFRGDLF